ncbi:MAG: ABC transporter ATP-binding protein [Hyphomicrobiales bacterium]
MLKVEGLKVLGLDPVSFTVEGGECIAVRGASGSGKSLLLRALADLDPAPGSVVLDDVERASINACDWRKKVRYFQAEPGFWAPTVGAHLENSELLTRLGLPEEAMDWQVERLSTGEKQRVSLARGFADNPQVLLLDEPTSGLDADATKTVEALIGEAVEAGAHALVVSHDAAQSKRLAKRALAIEDGKVGEAAR